MDYFHTYPNAVICYYASDIILKITSDAAYLVLPKARSCAAVHYLLGWANDDLTNGPLEVLCKTIKNVVRAVDCSVQLKSIGRWFDSDLGDIRLFFCTTTAPRKVWIILLCASYRQ